MIDFGLQPAGRLLPSGVIPALALTLILAACGGESADPEDEVRAWLASAEQEAEARDRRALMRRVADGYRDARGNDRDAVENLLRFYLLRQQNLAMLTRIEALELSGDTAAEVTLTAAMAGTGGSAGPSADAWRFRLDLEKRDGEWLLIGARWGRIGDVLR